MRPIPRYPTETPLPWPPAEGQARRERAGIWPLHAEQVARFDALLHEIHADAPRVDADRLSNLARWLLDMPESQAQNVLDERLSRIQQLRAMLADPDWDCEAADCARVHKLLDYLDQPDNLIPDRIPLLGKLDDVLLLELAWPALADEADEYDDFSQWRATEQGSGSGQSQRAAWIRDRLAALALVHHNRRVNADHYAESGRPSAPFRVGG